MVQFDYSHDRFHPYADQNLSGGVWPGFCRYSLEYSRSARCIIRSTIFRYKRYPVSHPLITYGSDVKNQRDQRTRHLNPSVTLPWSIRPILKYSLMPGWSAINRCSKNLSMSYWLKKGPEIFWQHWPAWFNQWDLVLYEGDSIVTHHIRHHKIIAGQYWNDFQVLYLMLLFFQIQTWGKTGIGFVAYD